MRSNSKGRGHYVGSERNGTWLKVPNMIKEPRIGPDTPTHTFIKIFSLTKSSVAMKFIDIARKTVSNDNYLDLF